MYILYIVLNSIQEGPFDIRRNYFNYEHTYFCLTCVLLKFHANLELKNSAVHIVKTSQVLRFNGALKCRGHADNLTLFDELSYMR